MREGILHIQLMNGPAPRECQRENSPDNGGLDDRAESLCKIHTRALSETSKHPTRFVALQSPVGVELVLEDPRVGDDIGSRRTRHKIPSVVLHQSIMFFYHSSSPIWVGKSTTVGLRDGGDGRDVVQCRHPKATLGSRLHGVLIGRRRYHNSTRRRRTSTRGQLRWRCRPSTRGRLR